MPVRSWTTLALVLWLSLAGAAYPAEPPGASSGSVAEEISDEVSARVRLASTHAAQSAAEAVDLMFNAAGTTAIYASSRL
jgi:hypothetical protein